jgi:hypothetical protein
MDKAAKPLENKFLRGETQGTDTGWIQPAMGAGNPGATSNLRGVEHNTARGVKAPVVLQNIIRLEYAAATDAPEVIPFDTYEDD